MFLIQTQLIFIGGKYFSRLVSSSTKCSLIRAEVTVLVSAPYDHNFEKASAFSCLPIVTLVPYTVEFSRQDLIEFINFTHYCIVFVPLTTTLLWSLEKLQHKIQHCARSFSTKSLHVSCIQSYFQLCICWSNRTLLRVIANTLRELYCQNHNLQKTFLLLVHSSTCKVK